MRLRARVRSETPVYPHGDINQPLSEFHSGFLHAHVRRNYNKSVSSLLCAHSDGENTRSVSFHDACHSLAAPSLSLGLILSPSEGKLQDRLHFNRITEIRPDTNGISCRGKCLSISQTHTHICMWIQAKVCDEESVCVCICVSIRASRWPLAHRCALRACHSH